MNGVALHTLEFFGYDVSGQFAGSLQGLKKNPGERKVMWWA